MPIQLIGCFCCKNCRRLLPLKDQVVENKCGKCLQIEIELTVEEQMFQLECKHWADNVFAD